MCKAPQRKSSSKVYWRGMMDCGGCCSFRWGLLQEGTKIGELDDKERKACDKWGKLLLGRRSSLLGRGHSKSKGPVWE